MMWLVETIVGAVIVLAVASVFGLPQKFWRRLRRPVWLAFEAKDWTQEEREMLEKAGYDFKSGKPNGTWVINYEIHTHIARGYKRFHFGFFRREFRTLRKVEYALLMKKP